MRKLPGGGAKANVECYSCGVKEHLAKDCRYRGRAAPVESKGGSRSKETTTNNGTPCQVATVSTQDEDTVPKMTE